MILKWQSSPRKGYHIDKRLIASREPSALKELSVSKEFIRDLVTCTNKRPTAMQIDPCEVYGYISLPRRWMTLIDGEASDGSYVALHTLYAYFYMETSCVPHIKTLSHNFLLPKKESILKILMTLTQPFPYKENPCIAGIQVSSTSLYKKQASSFPKYVENLQLSHYRVLRDFSFIDLTFGRSLAGAPPVPSIKFLLTYSLGTHKCDQQPSIH